MVDHCIDGRVLYPFAGHVVLAWKTYCKVRNLEYLKTPICIENMSVYRATILGQQAVKLDVDFSAGNGTFEIMEGDQLAACGKISIPENLKIPSTTAAFPITDRFAMTGAEVYKELRLRGYDYGPHFRSIQKASEDCRRTEIAWSDNFVPYIDALLQAYLISEKGDSLHLPVRLRYLAIDP
uniref:Polyketide synthase dehydratase domain-containing protein n=1 Tax=Romanomermis culicivorax TaxID=13658 RepID=A0A915JNR6_ROMCU